MVDAAKDTYAIYVFFPTPLQLDIPKGWPKPARDMFANNPLTEEGFKLGRRLFYEGKLSKDGNFSCATCHQQFAGFSNFDHDFSHGFNNTFTTRNAPPLFNLAWMTKFQWDGGVNHLELQALGPMTASNEMAETLDSVIIKLNKDTSYKRMFFAAFGSNEVTTPKILKALAQFTGSLISATSKYDKVKNGLAKFNAAEENGYAVYKTNCSVCHAEPLFTDNSFRNNGLRINDYYKDYGRMKITGKKSDSLKFKVPSLRNVAVTFPYMHDGRIYTLDEVIDHYRCEIVKSPTLDPLLLKPIEISEKEKKDLVSFLYTLTDFEFFKNQRFSIYK